MLNRKNYKEKTYNMCLYCDHRGASCYGPRTSDLPIERWREYMRDIKEVEGLTYSVISKRTQEIGIPIPAKTIERKLAPGGDGQDIMRETARAIEIAILGSAPYPCYLAFVESQTGQANAEGKDNTGEVQRLLHELEMVRTSYKEELESVRSSYKAELETVRSEAQQKIDYLRTENEKKDRIIDRLLK